MLIQVQVDVCGISDGTKDHTIVRKSSVSVGNSGDWTASAGTNTDDCEWLVFEQNDWTNLGSHSLMLTMNLIILFMLVPT